MADYSINAVPRRVVYTGSAGVGPYAFTFEVLSQTDIAVYKNSTKLVLTTNYTVTINANGTGSVTLVSAATGSDRIVITGARAIQRTTDFATAGDLIAASLNEQFDAGVIFSQQVAETAKRSLAAPVYDPEHVDSGGTLDMTLPAASSRASLLMGFNSLGNPTTYPTSGNSAVASGVSWVQSGSGAVGRTVEAKLRDTVSVKDFGAVGDGVADDTAAFAAARDAHAVVEIPPGTYSLANAFDTQTTTFLGYGATLTQGVPATTYLRNYTDFGKKAITRSSLRDASEYSATPTTYTYLNTLSSINMIHSSQAGYQQNYTSDSGGRTSCPAIYIEAIHGAYGDGGGIVVQASISRHASHASITNWTGANSATLFAGESGAVTDNVNLYGAEWHLNDYGKERVSANGLVVNMVRDNGNASNSGAYNTVWTGLRLQTAGSTYSSDSALSVNGLWNVGIDFSGSTLTNECAMALKSQQRIYWGVPATSSPDWFASTLSTNYITFNTTGNTYSFVANGATSFQMSDTFTKAFKRLILTESINVLSSGNTANTVGATGGASALPANPSTYLIIQVDNTNYKIPVYNA